MHAGFAQRGDRLVQIALQNTAMPGNFHRAPPFKAEIWDASGVNSRVSSPDSPVSIFVQRPKRSAPTPSICSVVPSDAIRQPIPRMTSTAPTISLQGA